MGGIREDVQTGFPATQDGFHLKAMQEMRRVTKKDGLIASVTAQSFAFQPRYMGNYPSSHRYIHEYRSMHSYISGLYERIQPSMDYLQYGTDPLNIPSLFAQSNLRNIEMHPIGCAFSLSNSTLTLDEKKQIIELEYMAERNKFEEFYKLPTFAQYISNEDAMRYLDLLLSRKNMLLCNLNDNSIWEWFGGAQILMIGQK